MQQFAGFVAHLLQAGDGVAGLGAQANRPAVALAPFGGDQLIQHLWRIAGPSSSTARTASVTRSRRVSSRAADRTWAGSVRCVTRPVEQAGPSDPGECEAQ
ncbi:hypothetical protein IQ61_02880 [Streptomyces scabiei]|nr:hypothetical protein IQ61_02880 [Streptomyces scabiei]